MKEDWPMMLLVLLIVTLGWWAISARAQQIEQEKHEQGCEYYRDFEARDVPAKCLKYFTEAK